MRAIFIDFLSSAGWRRSSAMIRAALVLACLCTASMPARAETAVTLLFSSNLPEIATENHASVAELAAVIADARATNPETFFLHGGDSLGPNLLGSFDHGAHMVDLLNAAEIDLMAVAKRELTYGEDTLTLRAQQAGFPLLTANLTDRRTGQPPAGTEPYTMIMAGDLSIGVFALTSPEITIDYLVEDLAVADYPSVIKAVTANMRREGADIVILMLDFALPDLAELMQGYGIDIVLHASTDGDAATRSDQGIIIQQGKEPAVAVLDITFDDGPGTKSPWQAQLRRIPLTGYRQDTALLALQNAYLDRLSGLLDTQLGVTNTPLDTRRDSVRTAENAFGNFIADVVQQNVDGDIAIINGGGIRGDRRYSAGTALTRRDIQRELPFRNAVTLIEVTGRQMVAALENGFSRVEDQKGRFPHVSNMTVYYDPDQPAGERVIAVKVGETPLDPMATYRLATLDYLAQGGDGFTAFIGAPRLVKPDPKQVLWQVVAAAILQMEQIAPVVEDRLLVSRRPTLN
ncbi:MAG: bifunctional metallophosphatase/5'-nucleotidase [Magnetospiraceae bacterium]